MTDAFEPEAELSEHKSFKGDLKTSTLRIQ